MWFGRRNKRSRKISREEALESKPLRAAGAELKPTDDGGGKLVVPLRTPTRFAWLLRMPAGATKTFELDSLGVFVWESCDGKTSVQQIIRKLAKRYNLGLRQAEVPTVQFLQMLGRKGLIGMSAEEDDKATRRRGDKAV
jgi:hypothetical protein